MSPSRDAQLAHDPAAPDSSAAPTRTVARPQGGGRVLAVLVADELRDQARTPLIWGGAIGVMGALLVAIWPTIESSISGLMDQYPASIKQAFGIASLDTVELYLDAELMSIVIPLAMAFLAVRCVTRPTVAAEDAGHLDTMLALPISRRVLAWSSFLVAGVVVALTLLVVWALTMLASVSAGSGLSATVFGRGLLNVWPLAMVFAGLALLAGGLARGAARVSGVAIGVLVGMYVMDLVGKLAPSAKVLADVSAFHYYGSAIQTGLHAGHIALLLGAAVLLAAAGAEAFTRRDV